MKYLVNKKNKKIFNGLIPRYEKVNIKNLWNGRKNNGSIVLNESFKNFDFIFISSMPNGTAYASDIIKVSDMSIEQEFNIGMVQEGTVYSVVSCSFSNETTLNLGNQHNNGWSNLYITNIYGINL